MKSFAFAVVMTVITSLISYANADGVDDTSLQRLEQQLPSTLEQFYQKHQLKGDLLLAVVDKNGLRYSYTLNTKGNDAVSNGLTTETPFLIASHTKAFTGTLAQVLATKGNFQLDAPIKTYLANEITHSKIASDTITVEQLLNHTAGFTSIMHTFKTAFLGYETEAELIDALNTDTLVAPTGVFRYSNTGPILAARAIENATRKNWKKLMAASLFSPLSMHNTSSTLSAYPTGTILPSIEIGADGEVLRTGLYKTDKTLHAAGGSVSTLGDMAKWLQFNLNQGEELSAAANFFKLLHSSTTIQKKTYYTYERTGYSLAWDIATYHDNTILTRFGGYAGISFHASFMPEQGVAVIAFFNDQRGYLVPHLAANLAYNLVIAPELAQSRYGEELKGVEQSITREQENALDPKARVPFSVTWQNLLGTYENNNGWPVITLTEKENHLWLSFGVLEGSLYEEEEGGYIVNLGSLRRSIKLSVSDAGKVTLMNGSLEYIKHD
ncbi:class C beta-lactamase-related serine hydrolase [Alteromonas sediminis]|uniref:Class C beta-lactamase-related serine hydrolase n=1 Tax=Alteromonas sediminis TaxID=2259342 RepID=A0A3N5Y2S9_9ALTE|nr:serine hydrolase [Alteromonas sediminis]RPJ66976.1 class C beta-lactamase-related serine hydrolase [Alteromonas sediminis]